MKRNNKRLWLNIGYVLLTVFSGVILVGAQLHHSSATVQAFHLNIDITKGDDFLSPDDIKEQVILKLDTLVGEPLSSIGLSDIERVILEEEAIQEASVYLNSKNELVADVEMKKVIMRIKPNDAEGYYIDEYGKLMRWIPQFTPKVLTFFGEGDKYPRYANDTLSGWEYNQKLIDDLFAFYQALENDPFCKAQIGSVYINADGELEINPLVGEQRVIFGAFEEVPEKLKKLKVFYKEIVKQAGWSKYHTVNLKFKNQIVCK